MSTTVEPRHSPGHAGGAVPPVSTVAILGAGRVGTALARALVEAGHEVRVAGPGPAEDIRLIVEVVAPGAQPRTAADAVAGADLVILALPLHRLGTVDPALLKGRVVVDVMNYWEPVDGVLPAFAQAERGTSRVVAGMLPEATVVKAFNHIGYHDIESDRRPHGAPDRRALAVLGDDADAVAAVMSLVDAAGFDPVDAGGLDRGVLVEAGEGVFGVRLDAERLRALVGG